MAIVIEQLCRSHAVPLWEGMTEASVAHQLERACVLCAGKLNGSPRDRLMPTRSALCPPLQEFSE
jgi:hypothetical protein